MLRPFIHLLLHFTVPGVVARIAFKDRWVFAWVLMGATILVDLDHLLASPIFDPNRCSIPFHPLHSYWAIAIYCLLTLYSRSRLLALGLLIHMGLDWTDCVWMSLG
ncbi:MAG: hypothetical protein HQM13_08675 [SAR324 cluster bacterium]|nr:hypothetical protein [SAR324 cluster bacterium]